MKKQSIFIFLIMIVALGIGLWREHMETTGGVTSWGQKADLAVGTAIPLPQAVPAFTLEDMHGQPFSNMALKRHWSLMVFGYTRCPDSCPIILESITKIQHQLRQQSQVETLFITIEPEHDTAENLMSFFQKEEFKGIPIRGLTGPKERIQSLASELGLHLGAALEEGKHIEHSGTLLLINPEGKITALFTRVDEPTAIAQDVKNMIHRYNQG
jgi:protein SCO1/2